MKRLANTSLNARMLFCRICLDYKEFVHTFVADGSAVTFRRPGADGSAVTFRRPGADGSAVTFRRPGADGSAVTFRRPGADGSAVTFRRHGADGSAVTFRRPGATHKAHWMAPILYTLKVALTEKTIVQLPAGTVNVAWNELQLK